MTIRSSTLRRVAALDLPSETMREVLAIIAEVEEVEEDRRERDRLRKRRSMETDGENPRNFRRTSTESHAEFPLENPGKEGSEVPPRDITQPPPNLRENTQTAREGFAEFRSVYPKRNGSQPWTPAEQIFIRHIKSGVISHAIVDGARAYAASMVGKNPEYVAQAVTWLRQKRWLDDHIAAPPARAGPFNGASPKRNPSIVYLEKQRENYDPSADEPYVSKGISGFG